MPDSPNDEPKHNKLGTEFWQNFLEYIVTFDIREGQYWDYKETLTLGKQKNDEARRKENQEILKDITAFANAESGVLIYGMSNKSPRHIVGIDNPENCLTKIVHLLERECERSIGIEIVITNHIISTEKKNCLILLIPKTSKAIGVKHYKIGHPIYYLRKEMISHPLRKQSEIEKLILDKKEIVNDTIPVLSVIEETMKSQERLSPSNSHEDIWRGYSSLDQLPPKEIFQEILVNIDKIPYISQNKLFLECIMCYKTELSFEDVKIETFYNILEHKDHLNYSLSQWNKLLERIIQTTPGLIALKFIGSTEFLEGVFKDKILEEIESNKYKNIGHLLEIVSPIDKNSSKRLIGYIIEGIEVNRDCTITYIWDLFLRLGIIDEKLGRHFFNSIQWKIYLRGDKNEQIKILTDILQKKGRFLEPLQEKKQKELKSFIIKSEKRLINKFPWNEIVTEDSNYFTLLPLLYQFNQWEGEEILVLSSLPWDIICQRTLKEESHNFFLKSIPTVILNSRKFLKVQWFNLLIGTKRLDYLNRFLTSIQHIKGGLSLYFRILERIARNPEEIKYLLKTSPKREIETFSKFFISKKTKKWHKILNYLDTQDWGYHGKNSYENYGYKILINAGLNQPSIEDYFRKYQSDSYYKIGSNINLILISLLLGTRNEQIIKKVILKSFSEHEKKWLYLIDFSNFLKADNQRLEPYFYKNEIIDFNEGFGCRYSHLFCLILLLEILGKFDKQDGKGKQLLQSIFQSIENCIAFIIENKNKLPSEKDPKDSSRDVRVSSFNVNNLASLVINDPSIITNNPSEQDVLGQFLNIFQYSYFLTFEGIEEKLKVLGSRFLEHYYHYNSNKAESFASKWKKEKNLFNIYYTTKTGLIREFLVNQVLSFIEARMNGEDLEVSNLFHLAFPEAKEKILVIKNLGDLLKSDFHSINLAYLELANGGSSISEEWINKIDWRRIFRSDYSLNELKSVIEDYYWRDILENVLNDVFDENNVKILFKICLKEEIPLVALNNLYFLFERRSQMVNGSNQVFQRIINLPVFQNYIFTEDLDKLEIIEALKLMLLIYSKWDKNIGTSILNDSSFIDKLKHKIHCEKIEDLIDTWYFIFKTMEDDPIEFVLQLKDKIFPINWKGSIDNLIDLYVKRNDIKNILRNIPTLKQALVDKLPNLLNKATPDEYSFEFICHNIAILLLIDGSLAEQVVASLSWDEHFDTKKSYNLNNGFEIIAEYWGERLILVLIQSKGFNQIQIQDRKYKLIPHDTYELIGKPWSQSDVVWQKKMDLLIKIPSFWEIDWIEQLKILVSDKQIPTYKNHFFMLIEIFTKHPEHPEVQKMFNTQRFIDIPWDLAYEIHESDDEELFINTIIDNIRGVSQKTADEILRIYFSEN